MTFRWKTSNRARDRRFRNRQQITFSGWFLLMTASSMFFPPDWTTWERTDGVSSQPNSPLTSVTFMVSNSFRASPKELYWEPNAVFLDFGQTFTYVGGGGVFLKLVRESQLFIRKKKKAPNSFIWFKFSIIHLKRHLSSHMKGFFISGPELLFRFKLIIYLRMSLQMFVCRWGIPVLKGRYITKRLTEILKLILPRAGLW